VSGSWIPARWRGLTRMEWLARGVIAWCFACMGYGLVHFPDAPIQPCGPDHFCGKRDTPHTREEYDAFRLWEKVIFLSWPFGMASGFFLRSRSRAGAAPRHKP